MPESPFRAQHSPSPKPGTSMLPPLSKYYYGPAQGWASAESSPSHNSSSWSLSKTTDVPPMLPPRLSPGPPAYTSPHWMNNFLQLGEQAQGWQPPGPPPSAPPASQFSTTPYHPNDFTPMSSVGHLAVDPTWDSGPSTESPTWAIKQTRKPSIEPGLKSQLPPKSHLPFDHVTNVTADTDDQDPRVHKSKASFSRLSATTIDVPLFLQPVAYDPGSAPPLPQPLPQGTMPFPLAPPKVSPAPSREISIDQKGEMQSRTLETQWPQYNPRNSFLVEQPQNSQTIPRRPRHDPQKSHDEESNPLQMRNQAQQHSIPPPKFTNFNVESALPPAKSDETVSSQPPLRTVNRKDEANQHRAGQQLRQSFISPIAPSDIDRSMAPSNRWETGPMYTPSPEPQHIILSQIDGQSTSNTDVSSNHAGVSTPESHQTSNISYRESENQGERSRSEGKMETDDSFYWHSGRSSSDAEDDQSGSGSPTATPGAASVDQGSSTKNSTSNIAQLDHQDQKVPARSTSMSPSTYAHYGASALGFGGPSDWEYFGDYEAEEIDDEDLYSRPKRIESTDALTQSAELPGDLPSVHSERQHRGTELPGSNPIPKASPPLLERSPSRGYKSSFSKEDVPEKGISAKDVEERESIKSPLAQSPATPRAASGGTAMLLDISPDQQRLDLDEVIRAWSEAPYVGKVDDKAATASNDDDLAEASLASTPRERMLGIDVLLRDAPSLPRLPDSFEQLDPEQDPQRPDLEGLDTPNVESPTEEARSSLDKLLNLSRTTTATEEEDQIPAPVQIETTQIEKSYLPPSSDATKSSDSPDAAAAEPAVTTESSVTSPSSEFTDAKVSEPAQEVSQAVVEDDIPKKKRILVHETMHQSPQDDPLFPKQVDASSQVQERSTDQSQTSIRKLSQAVPNMVPPGADQQPSKRSPSGPSLVFSPSAAQRIIEATLQGVLREESVDPPSNMSGQDADQDALRQPHVTTKTISLRAKTGVIGEPFQKDAQRLSAISPLSNSPRIRAVTEDQQTDITHSLSTKMATLSDSKVDNTGDPYRDLDPWGKASLNRFAAMLREEARAETNKDKLNIFNVFTSRESRLRVILYGNEDDLIVSPDKEERKIEERVSVQKPDAPTDPVNLQRSLKALPALPASRDSVKALQEDSLAPLVIQDRPKIKQRAGVSAEPAGEDSYVMVNTPSDTLQYSPGGRPKVSSLAEANNVGSKHSLQGTNTPSVRTGNAYSQASESKRFVPTTKPSSPRNVPSTQKSASSNPKYHEGQSEVNNYIENRKSVRKSIHRPYTTLTQGSLESGSNFGREPDIKTTSPIVASRSQYNLLAQIQGGDPPEVPKMTKQKAPGSEVPLDFRRFIKADFDPLILVLPKYEANDYEPVRLHKLRDVMEAIPDDFSFIHQSVVAWDAKTKKQCEENDMQRHARQVESEQRIDSLFNEHEIGYGDISELESEFKRSEANRKADEDRSEYTSFVSDVFDLVWTRLHYELDQLMPHYEQYTNLMNETLAGKDIFEQSENGLALAPTMNTLLALHQKLEIRHQKAFEAVLERDRRLKKTEISPWYTLSNIAKVKQLEKQFEEAEKKAIIEYCQQRDTRINRLMDVLDQNTLRGVGANQDYMEAIMKAVRRIASGRAFASTPASNESVFGVNEVAKARTVTAVLAAASEQIVQTFHVADMLLNSADYEVSVAKAKVTKADMATLAKLKEEKAKEDQKLMRDLEHRLALIREDSRRTNDEIEKLMLFLGLQNERTPANDASPQAGLQGAGHEARMQRALEEAKRRNALKETEAQHSAGV